MSERRNHYYRNHFRESGSCEMQLQEDGGATAEGRGARGKCKMKEVNRNVSEVLAKERNDAEESAASKKKARRGKERANRMRGERKEKNRRK